MALKRAPSHFDETACNTHHHETAENLFHKYYFGTLDILIGEIERRFESPTFTLLYSKVEVVLQNAATVVDVSCADVKDIVDHFDEDLQDVDLRTELAMLKNTMQGIEFLRICKYRKIDFKEATKEFVHVKGKRLTIFGKF